MTISEIRRAEASLEVKAAAVSNLFPPVHQRAFEWSLQGVLGEGDIDTQRRAAYRWIIDNYKLVAAVIYAASELSEQVYQGLVDLDSMLMKFEERKEATK